MRTYEGTHPWISFSVDLGGAAPALWILLGEASSKSEHIAGVPLRPSTAQELHKLFLAKGALATTAIEGNTLSEEEVLKHPRGELRLPPSRQYLAKEIDNIVTACNGILEQVTRGEALTLLPETIMIYNAQVLKDLAVDPGIVPGQVRTHSVGVARYRGAPAEDCEYLLHRLCDWLNGHEFDAPEGMELVYAIVKAVLAHLYLAWIHPFGDGNGRTARLLEYQILVGSGVPSPAAHLLSNHYNLTRSDYYRQLDTASRSSSGVIPFLVYAIRGFVDGLRLQLDLVRDQQWDVAWRNYVHEAFHDKDHEKDHRRRHLVLDLSQRRDPVPRAELRSISPRVAAAYARKTDKTLSRDLNALRLMNLIKQDAGGFVAHRELILAFLPRRAGSRSGASETQPLEQNGAAANSRLA